MDLLRKIPTKTAICTGITGQDGSILARFLLDKDYKVYGLKRRTSSHDLGCSKGLENDMEIIEGDIEDLSSLLRLCKLARPDEFYGLAAQSHVGTSFEQPIYTVQVTGVGVLNCLEAIRLSGIHTKFYNAATSELFGGVHGEAVCNEETPFCPRSPYACAKLLGFSITSNYRQAYKMFACSGILFNHEAEGKRGPNFVTRKISLGIAAIRAGKQHYLYLGNLDAKRDWGHANDYMKGAWMILNHREPDDYVLATGETHSVREFCEIAFHRAKLGDYQKYIKIDPKFFRPAEVDVLIGDSSKAYTVLGWKPKVTFEELVHKMVDYDLKEEGVVL